MADPKKPADRIYWETNEVDEEAALPPVSSSTPPPAAAAAAASTTQDKGITFVAPTVPASASRPGLRRERSNGSLSIRPLSRRNSIDATAALPIQYRTLSIDVDEYAQKRLPLKKDKKTVAGKFSFLILLIVVIHA